MRYEQAPHVSEAFAAGLDGDVDHGTPECVMSDGVARFVKGGLFNGAHRLTLSHALDP